MTTKNNQEKLALKTQLLKEIYIEIKKKRG